MDTHKGLHGQLKTVLQLILSLLRYFWHMLRLQGKKRECFSRQPSPAAEEHIIGSEREWIVLFPKSTPSPVFAFLLVDAAKFGEINLDLGENTSASQECLVIIMQQDFPLFQDLVIKSALVRDTVFTHEKGRLYLATLICMTPSIIENVISKGKYNQSAFRGVFKSTKQSRWRWLKFTLPGPFFW